MLTMLQLILSMTQKLGPSIMSKVTQIIGLANNILEHRLTVDTVDGVEPIEPIEPIEQTEEENAEEADSEILGLVLSLLVAILTGKLNKCSRGE
jgi:hypothetical protein